MDRQRRLEYMARADAGGGGSAAGILGAPARMAALFDEGTFAQLGALVTRRPTELDPLAGSGGYGGVYAGYGSVGGKLVFAWSQDSSVQSGALGEAYVRKIMSVYETAEKNGAPVVAVFDSAGLKIEEGIDALSGYGSLMRKAASLSGLVPQIAAVCGVCAGGASALASLSDFVFIEEKRGRMFMTPPFIINASGGEAASDTGSAECCVKAGLASMRVTGEAELFASVRRLLACLPSNNMQDAPFLPGDDLNRRTEELEELLESDYDVRELITHIADREGFLEVGGEHAGGMVCGFIGLGGFSTGVVANQPRLALGAISPEGAEKAARFISFCDSFNIPILTVVDTAGMEASGAAAEVRLPRSAARLAAAYAGATVTKLTLISGKAYGTAYALMNPRTLGADMVFAYPASSVSILPPETAVNFLYAEKIAAAGYPEGERARLTGEWEAVTASPLTAGASGLIDQIIEPAQTRKRLASALFVLQNKREITFPRKHGTFTI